MTILAEGEPGDEEDNTSWSERLALIEGNHRASGTIEAATLTEKSDRTELIVMSRRHRGDFRLDAYITFHAGPFVAIVGEGDADVRALFEGVIATLELSDPPNGVTPSGLRDG